jgi:hypothetical protein
MPTPHAASTAVGRAVLFEFEFTFELQARLS